jgi:tripartite ATP-independent transporter DctM subunit
MMPLAVCASFIVLLAVGMPVAFGMTLTTVVYLVGRWDVPFVILPQKMVTSIDSFPLMAVPFFVLVGQLMNTGGMTDRIFRLARGLVGHIPGGLAHANVAGSMIFAGMSGSAVADAAGLGQVEIRAMLEDGYDPAFTATVTAVSATIGPIIPPSIAMVIYGAITGASVPRLLIGGLVPGLLMGFAMMVVIYILAKYRNYPRFSRVTMAEFWESFWKTLPSLLTPVILIGGMITGIFTPTETAAVAVFYAVILTCFIHREMDFRSLLTTFVESGVMVAVILLVIAAAGLIGWILNWQRVPDLLATALFEHVESPALILLIINVFLLIVGCFIEANAALIMLTPILHPIVTKVGIDPIHFGVVMVFNLMIGLITPPVGMTMYVTCAFTKTSMLDFSREAWPFIAGLIAVLFVISYVPQLVLFVPDLLMGK